MQQHIEQARHNQALLDDLDKSFPDQYHDWKITILFYIAFHYLKALAASRRTNIGDNHREILANIKPPTIGKYPKMPIQKGAFTNYSSLLNYSWGARYTGITDLATFEALKKTDYPFAVKCLDQFKLYIQGQGINL